MLYLNIFYIYITLQLYELQEWQRLKWFHDSMPKLPCHFRGNISAKDCLEGFSLFGQWDDHRGSLVIMFCPVCPQSDLLTAFCWKKPWPLELSLQFSRFTLMHSIVSCHAVSCRVVPSWPSDPGQKALAAPPIEAPRWLALDVRRSSLRLPRSSWSSRSSWSCWSCIDTWNLLKLQSHFSNLQ